MAHDHRMNPVGEPHLNKRAVQFSDISGYADYTAPEKPYVYPANQAVLQHDVEGAGTRDETHILRIGGINHWSGHADDVESAKSALTPYVASLKEGVDRDKAQRHHFNGLIHYPNNTPDNKTKGLYIR